jgi:hypothetical protein
MIPQEVWDGDGDLGEKARKASDSQQRILEGFQRSSDEPGPEWNEDQGQQSAEVGERETDRQSDVNGTLDLITTHPVVPIELFQIFNQEGQHDEVVVGGEGGQQRATR